MNSLEKIVSAMILAGVLVGCENDGGESGLQARALESGRDRGPTTPATSLQAGQSNGRVMTFEDLSAVRVVSDPQISPDGRSVLYSVRVTDLPGNKRTSVTYLIGIDGGSRRLFPNAQSSVSEARWSPDGKSVAYVADGQLWIADADGANPRQLTKLSGGATGPVWSPLGNAIAFVSSVYPDCRDDACNAARDKAAADNPVKAHIADKLMFRHWSSWKDGKSSHLFIVPVRGGGPRDLIPGAAYDVPPGPFGGSEGYSFSPDGTEMAFTAKNVGRSEAWSTNVDVYTIPSAGGTPFNVSYGNEGADQNPVYVPPNTGKWLLYQSQGRAGFESDKWQLIAYQQNRREHQNVLASWDRNVDAFFLSPNGHVVFINTSDLGRNKLFRTRKGGTFPELPTPLVLMGEANNSAFSRSGDGTRLVWIRDAVNAPGEVYTGLVTDAGMVDTRQLTHENDELVAQLRMHPAESFWFKGAGGTSVHAMLIKPPQWEPGKKFPLILLVHGGPQVPWHDSWHGRWNMQLFASTGAAVLAINPRGSPGYGQKFVDEVTKDWGGKVYVDLMRGVDAALQKYPWLDSTRMTAAGGSFGGYMMNWFAGHTNRFRALVSHAGVFDLEHMYGATEELWFTEWEFGGPYWDKKAMETQYRVWSPHLFASRFRTPMLVVHGQLDYRVPYTEGIALFTALQRQSVPSRLLVFPDEGHWITKPQNAKLWWKEVLGWLTRYSEPALEKAQAGGK
jgi:dipeptidyl aminopeptidase/acylaminoacyl peptidase